jgi:sulfoxide reductase catalytic subunit YedY
MLIKRPSDIPASEITPQGVWLRRRELIRAAASGVGQAAAGGLLLPWDQAQGADATVKPPGRGQPIPGLKPSAFSTAEAPTDYADITSYGNFTEFGSNKSDPARYAWALETRPWTVVVDGECEAPGRIGIEDILSGFTQEERIYRLRCVEAWSMVIPWVGIPLASVIKRYKPTSKAT